MSCQKTAIKTGMNEETYRKIIDDLFKDEKFVVYGMDRTNRYRATYGPEQDHDPEFNCIFRSIRWSSGSTMTGWMRFESYI